MAELEELDRPDELGPTLETGTEDRAEVDEKTPVEKLEGAVGRVVGTDVGKLDSGFDDDDLDDTE